MPTTDIDSSTLHGAALAHAQIAAAMAATGMYDEEERGDHIARARAYLAQLDQRLIDAGFTELPTPIPEPG